MNKELLEKYCNNYCTKEELKSVLAWFKESAGTSEGKSLLYKIWDELRDDNNLETNFDLLLDKIHHAVNLTQTKKLLKESDENLIKSKRRKYYLTILTRVAAILMFPILGFGLYMSFKYQSTRNGLASTNLANNEIFSSVDAITKVTLPDGSKVWLNHSSSLKYPAMFHGASRTVELTGEGYFEVEHNPKIPFIVKAGDLQVLARGTTFNIMSYAEEDRIETSLVKGEVELQLSKPDGRGIPLMKMRPNDMAIFEKGNKKISSRTISDDRYLSWKDGKLVFTMEPIGEVAKKLSRWYNVDIEVKDPELLELTYTAVFIHETLPQVMELIAMVSPVNYSISDRKEISQGTFTKRKVILSYRNKNR